MPIKPRRYQLYTSDNVEEIPQIRFLSRQQIMAIKAVAAVLPFRVNSYVVESLIDWSNIPEDPMFQLTFPQEGMLTRKNFINIYRLLHQGASQEILNNSIRQIHLEMNPHPAGQINLNVPRMAGKPLPGLQHKYRETVLVFPFQGQTCHTYCTYCFRWAQFSGKDNFKFANKDVKSLVRYLAAHPEVRDVLITGGDPMIMRAPYLRRYIEPLIRMDSIRSIRIGTKSLAWWPYRYITDNDADDVLRLFEDVVGAGKHLAFMAHYSHPRELSTPPAVEAIRRVHNTGASIRTQAPLIRHVNDSAKTWADLWQRQVDLGAIPYYMFIERDTGPKQYFEVPIAEALDIQTEAFRQLSGLGRTARGPVMSCTPGKIHIQGVAKIRGMRVFVLRFIQGRDPEWANQVFFAKYDPTATWLDDLRPAFEPKFFFESDTPPIIRKAV